MIAYKYDWDTGKESTVEIPDAWKQSEPGKGRRMRHE